LPHYLIPADQRQPAISLSPYHAWALWGNGGAAAVAAAPESALEAELGSYREGVVALADLHTHGRRRRARAERCGIARTRRVEPVHVHVQVVEAHAQIGAHEPVQADG